MKTREQQIEKRLEQMPRIYRAIYRSAAKGKSRKAAIHAQCLECCGYEKEEVRECTDSGCPLYMFRPYKERSNHSDNRPGFAPESTKSGKGGNYAG
jgi:hypothetical protein